jgi:hypothetical protein
LKDDLIEMSRPAGVSIQPGAVDFDLVFQRPAACHDADLQHQIYEKN